MFVLIVHGLIPMSEFAAFNHDNAGDIRAPISINASEICESVTVFAKRISPI